MNRIIISGTVVTEPRTFEAKDGKDILRARIAVTNPRRRDEERDYFTFVMFGGTASRAIRRKLGIGDRISIEGRLQNDSYTRRDGVEITENIIAVGNWEFAENKQDGEPQEVEEED